MIKVNEYSFPKVYEAEYGKITYDFDIFCNTVLKGTALDVACGTGRITTQLAKIGLICTGIDSNSSMLSIAIDKAKNLNLDIDYLNLDMRDFSLGKKFDLITIAGNSFQALLNESDQRNFLQCINQHLTDDGLFIISTRNSTENEMYTSSEFEYWHNVIDEFGKDVSV